MRKVRFRFRIAAAYLAFLFVVVELSLRFLLGHIELAGPDAVPVSDAFWRLEWVKRHAARSVAVTYPFDAFHATRGWALRRSVRDVSAWNNKTVNSNSRGLRGTAEVSYDRVPGKKRILVLGDSFTFGSEVSDDQTYPYYLGRLMPKAEVLNLGVYGYGHDQMLLYLKEEGVRYRPDIVLLGFVPFDIERNLFAFRDFAKPKFELTARGLELKGVPVPSPEKIMANEVFQLKLVDVIDNFRALYLKSTGRFWENAFQLTWAILGEMSRVVRGIGAEFVIVSLPVGDAPREAGQKPTPVERQLAEFSKKAGIRLITLRNVFPEAAKHWSPATHFAAATEIKAALKR